MLQNIDGHSNLRGSSRSDLPETFMEYVAMRLLGPPERRQRGGDSYWHCPFHNDSVPSFHTLPRRSGKRDYWKCWGCGMWGDEIQLLRSLRDVAGLDGTQGTFADHQRLIDQWRQDYEALRPGPEVPPTEAHADAPADAQAHRGGSFLSVDSLTYDPADDFAPEVMEATEELVGMLGEMPLGQFDRHMRIIQGALEMCCERGIHPQALAGQVGAWRIRDAENRRHMVECDDPECDWYCCRLARGWTLDQVRAEGCVLREAHARRMRRRA